MAKFLLSFLGYMPYRLALLVVQFCAKRCNSQFEVWPRNSFALGYLEPGYSDLDITLYSLKDGADVSSFFKVYRFLKIIFPYLGEINYYDQTRIDSLFSYSNFFELLRDPKVKHKLNLTKQGTPSEAAVFLLRQLEKDFQQLNEFPKKRYKKWSYHFSSIKKYFPDLKLDRQSLDQDSMVESIISMILGLCEIRNPIFWNEAHVDLKFYLELIEKDFEFHKLRISEGSSPWFVCFALPRLSPQQVCPLRLNIQQKNFIQAQRIWEEAGAISQTSSSSKSDSFKLHLDQLDSIIKKMDC